MGQDDPFRNRNATPPPGKIGRVLAEWRFTADEWKSVVGRGKTPGIAMSWVNAVTFAAVIIVLPVLFSLMIGNVLVRATVVAALLACGAGLSALFRYVTGHGQRRAAGSWQDRRVLIGEDGIYCGGDLTLWNRKTRVLKAVRIAASDPGLIEVVTGPSMAANVVDGAITALSVVFFFIDGAGGGGGTTIPTTTTVVPIPTDRRGEAAGVIAALLSPRRGVEPARPAPEAAPAT